MGWKHSDNLLHHKTSLCTMLRNSSSDRSYCKRFKQAISPLRINLVKYVTATDTLENNSPDSFDTRPISKERCTKRQQVATPAHAPDIEHSGYRHL